MRGFGPLHNKRTHRQQSTTNGQEREETHRHRLQFSPTANGIQPQPAAGTQRIRSEQSPKEPHAEADHHPAMARRLTPCGYTECIISSIELILRPSLKDASVSDGLLNTIEGNGQCSSTAILPATMILQLKCNSPIMPRMRTQSK
ncbi:hypothetical protein TcCL_ESM09230 [Trypanosoma cruzi]|nr:hypothetical protein TcCL_ESM09230 [Trypanosoma cruzi]